MPHGLCSRCKLQPAQEKHAWCKRCQSAYYQERATDPKFRLHLAQEAKRWRDENPERFRDLNRRRNLLKSCGATVKWYEEKFTEQGGCCAICGDGATPVRKGGIPRLCSDHDHETSELRGLLCAKCNFAISRLEEIPEWHEKALAYLAQYK